MLFTYSFVHTMRHLLVEMFITFKSTVIHNICTVCHSLAIHHRFNHRTCSFPNFAMIYVDSASFSNRRSHLRLEIVGAISSLIKYVSNILWFQQDFENFVNAHLTFSSNISSLFHILSKKIAMYCRNESTKVILNITFC